jgi:hypothetical protein
MRVGWPGKEKRIQRGEVDEKGQEMRKESDLEGTRRE